ncbi:MAG: hypothetical protein K2N93_03160, partial [Alistipes sp.]|nr:hypothetical protein [Alistipes sp.]
MPTARQQRKSEASGRKPHAETRTETQRLQKSRGAVPHAAAGIETGEIGHEEVAETRPEFDLRQAVVYA